MRVIVLQPTIIGGQVFEPKPTAQDIPDDLAENMIRIGNARPYETKIVEPVTEKKQSGAASGGASAAAQVSQAKTAKKSRKSEKPAAPE